MFWCVTLCGALLLTAQLVTAVNVDVENVLVHSGTDQSMFGFSVAMHISNGRPMLLVGAPTAASSRPDSTNGGAVFSCSVNAEHCQRVEMDVEGIRRNKSGEALETKSHQWFGSTLVSGGEDGHVLACAIRYQHHYNGDSNLYRLPIGNCFLSDSGLNPVTRISPCENKTPHHTRLGACQAGFSAAVDKKSGQVVLGAVGAYQWQGAGYSYDINVNSLVATDKKPQAFDDNYMGYATAIGEFTGDDQPEIVLGIPKGAQYNGSVEFYFREKDKLRKLGSNLIGPQLGSYFGSSLAVSDLNGDGLHDLVIGAPLFNSDYKGQGNPGEQGRVHIFYQAGKLEFSEGTPLEGTIPKGRFGFAVAAIGDINKDGFNDLAVGAPYAGEGLVYIFHGGANGVESKPSQTFGPEQLNRKLRTFGFAISGGFDLDRNEYPDLLVGAYASDKAVYLRSRPIVNIAVELKLDSRAIRLEDEGCSLPDGTKLPCVGVQLCFQYKGPVKAESLNLEYQIVLDTDARSSRAMFEGGQDRVTNSTVTLVKGSLQCVNKKAVFKRNPADKLSPIRINATYALVQNRYAPYQIRDYSAELSPVLSKVEPLEESIQIKKNCGADDVCVPDLQLTLSPNVTEYEVGSTRTFAVEVSASNRGEDAFNTKMLFTFHNDLDFVKVDKDNREDPVVCEASKWVSSFYQQILCDLDNPLKASDTLNFRMVFAANGHVPSVTALDFAAALNSTNKESESTKEDNEASFTLPVKVKINISISGKSDPTEVYYNSSAIDMNEVINVDYRVGPPIQHVYQVTNKGHDLDLADLYLVWPTHNNDNEPLLYMFERPTFKASRPAMLSCESPENFEFNANKLYVQPTTNKTRHIRDLSRFRADIGCGQLSKCAQFRCRIRNFTSSDVIIVTANSRLWLQSVAKMKQVETSIASKLVVNPVKLRFDVRSELPHEILYVETVAIDEDLLPLPTIPWWVIVLAIVIGILLLSLLIWILYKAGFFRRKRPGEPIDERGTKNGYHTVEQIPKQDHY